MSKLVESTIRRRADKNGYRVIKSRNKGWPTSDNMGEYMLIDCGTRIPAIGSYYDASLEDIDKLLSEPAEAASCGG